ncbi:hypothetical protein [Vitiosangium sp. GDMCC 1.1324]|uniref:hypothetical protein n=1 Tax=Vitiosangium sp. (strain GDMCC 1.1324) TaxID=2138576 RepID=UPI000D3B0E6D|nr:hypothetical protein [Vitiosangium sp. GDMCC 1.1324]PTL75208.1 hypothetical protein DAT35_56100 [Vitiosangium sp. GDMCC 1.1324]
MRGFIALTVLLLSLPALAAETRVVVRARARDGKFIGTSMGGARVVLRDTETGQVLASGLTTGTTGDTQRLMTQPHARGTPLTDEQAAKFETTLNLDEPRLVTVEVSAPEAQRQARVLSSTQVWLLPGKHLQGDGLILEVPGFVVDALAPQAHERLKLTGGKLMVPVRANVVLMCGCSTEPGGLWDSNRYEIQAVVKLEGKPLTTVPLSYAGKTSTFAGEIPVQQKGAYEVTVTAYDPVTGNTGVDRTSFLVE